MDMVYIDHPFYSDLQYLLSLKFGKSFFIISRLVKVKRQYRDIMNTMVALAPRLLSIFFLMLTIYYAFAIVGLEFFSFKVSQGCCNESWYRVQMFYADSDFANGTNDIDSPNVYYLNNFNNILSSYGEQVAVAGGVPSKGHFRGQPLCPL